MADNESERIPAPALEAGLSDKKSEHDAHAHAHLKGNILQGTVQVLDDDPEMTHFERKAALINQ